MERYSTMKGHILGSLLLITILLTGSICRSAMADSEPARDTTVVLYPGSVQMTVVNNKATGSALLDGAPFVQDGTAFIPVKGVLEALGATVTWMADKRQVEAAAADTRIVLTLDSNAAQVNNINVTMDKPARVINGRTFVPLRFVAENLGFIVNWDGAANKIEIINKTIASGDGITIGRGEFNQAVAWAKYMTEKQYGSGMWTRIAQNGQTWAEVFPQIVLDKFIAGEIVAKAAKSQNIQATESEITGETAKYQDLINGDPNLALMVRQNNIGQWFLRGMARENILGAKYQENYLNSVKISDDEIKQYYDDNRSSFSYEKVKAAHILIKTRDESSAEGKAYNQSAFQKATEIVKQARAGQDFAKLAGEYSEDPGTAPNGGELGYFGRGVMVKEFEDAAFSLNKGQISDVVQTIYGYHIIKVEDHITGILEFDQVKDDIKKLLANDKLQEHINSLVKEANVKIYGLE